MDCFLYIDKVVMVLSVFLLNINRGFKMDKLKISSPVFEEGEEIPKKYTCKGENVNPEINIENLSEKTKSLALVMDDPDAPSGVFVHWVVWNISPDKTKISENSVPERAVQGVNNFGKTGYGGPCPPSGTHRYYFKIYALDSKISLEQGASKQELEMAMEGKIIAQGELMGRVTIS